MRISEKKLSELRKLEQKVEAAHAERIVLEKLVAESQVKIASALEETDWYVMQHGIPVRVEVVLSDPENGGTMTYVREIPMKPYSTVSRETDKYCLDLQRKILQRVIMPELRPSVSLSAYTVSYKSFPFQRHLAVRDWHWLASEFVRLFDCAPVFVKGKLKLYKNEQRRWPNTL